MKIKKILATIVVGALAVTTIIGNTTFKATNETSNLSLFRFFEAGDGKDTEMYTNGYWGQQGQKYVPEWMNTDNKYLEPNYFRTSDGKVAYCIEPEKENPTTVTKNGTISDEAYRIIKNGYPAKSGSEYGISDIQLEWATTVALKIVEGKGEVYDVSDFGTNLIKTPTANPITSDKIKEVVIALVNQSKIVEQKPHLNISAESLTTILENKNYKVGPINIDSNINTELILNGAPSSASVTTSDGKQYFILIPEKDVLSELNFSVSAKGISSVISTDIYKPELNTQQNIYICENKEISSSLDIKIIPERKGIIKITKQDETGLALENVTFQIFNTDKKLVETITTNKEGLATSTQLPLAKYIVKETKTLDGYCLSSEEIVIELTPNDTSLITEVSKTVINKKNVIELNKVITGTNTGLEGAEFSIINAEGKTVSTIVSDKNGKMILTGIKAGNYIALETKAPKGYFIKNERTPFSVDEYGKVTGNTKIENSVTTVDIKKVDSDSGKTLEGATIEIRNSNKELVFTGKTNAKGILTAEKLPEGNYTATETIPPSGYTLNNEMISFSIDKYGKVTGNTTIKDKLTKITIIKKDAADSKLLAGAKIVVKNESGKIVFEGKTNEKGIVEIFGLAPGIYLYYEEEAPIGYIKTNEKSTFTVNSKGESLELTLLNSKVILSTKKTTEKTDSLTTTSSSSETIKTGIDQSFESRNVLISIISLSFASLFAFVLIFYRKKIKINN